ncbi:MAG TPA: PQQ-binding-like beta-propeller repeat protein [Candidatus Baltobacteraceae bacterium]|jgi:outer membrane protein assembly factor BamB
MQHIRSIASGIVLFTFPASLLGGCASSVAPVAPVSSLAHRAIVQTAASWEAGKKTEQWLQFGFDAGHSGYNPLEKIVNAKTLKKLKIAWNDKKIIQPGGIVVDHNVAYIDDMGQAKQGLYALNATTGARKWYTNLQLNGSWGSFTHAVAVVAGKVVVSPCSNGSTSMFLTGLCGVNAKTGKVLWRTYCTQYQGNPCGGLVNGGTSPTLYGNLVYFQSTQGVNEQPDTEALDPRTGAIVWDVPGVYHCPDAGDGSNNPLPAANGLVFAVLGCQGSQGATEICALSAATGAAVWCDQSPTTYIEDLIADGSHVYLTEPTSNLNVVALDTNTGAQAWTVTLPGGNYSAMATADQRLFVEDDGPGVYALSTATGKSLWSYTANANLYVGGVLSVANGIVYADGGGGNNGNVAITALSQKSGHLIWTSGSIGNGGARMTPVVLNGTVYAGCYTMCSFTVPAK